MADGVELRAHSVLELPAGTCERRGVREGDRLALGGLMSEQAAPAGRARPRRRRRGSLARAWRLLADESLLVLCTSIFAIAFVLRLSGQVNQDAWLALTGGRTLVDHGLPHHETWTIWGAGKEFVDQQWLGQAVLYLVHAVGGFGLLAGFHALLDAGARSRSRSSSHGGAAPRSAASSCCCRSGSSA